MTAFKGKFYRARERLKRLKEANDEVQNQLKETAHFRRVLAVQNRHLLDVLLLQQRAKGNVLADGECSDDPLSSESEDERLLDTELPSGFLLPTHIEHIVIPPVPSSVQNVQPVEEPKPKEPVIQPIPEPEPPQVKKPSPKKNSTPRKRQTKDTPTTGSSSKKQRTSKQAAQRPFTTQIITKGFLVDRPGFVSDAMIYPLGFKSLIIVSGTGDAFHFEVGELNGFPHVTLYYLYFFHRSYNHTI